VLMAQMRKQGIDLHMGFQVAGLAKRAMVKSGVWPQAV
jgi:hypothetical protein